MGIYSLPSNYLKMRWNNIFAIILFAISVAITHYWSAKVGYICILFSFMNFIGLLHNRTKRIKILIYAFESQAFPGCFTSTLVRLKINWVITKIITFLSFAASLYFLDNTLEKFDTPTWIKVICYIVGTLIFQPFTSRPSIERDGLPIADTLNSIHY